MSKETSVATQLYAHAWNADRSLIAVSPNNNEIIIYRPNGADIKQWKVVATLTGHDFLVTCLDWAPKSNQLLSCSQDRNAYVWTESNGEWNPKLVLLRMDRAATCCKWSPLENKFAVGSGSKLVAICHFDEENDWWVSKAVRVFGSTVTSIDWHPNNKFLLVGSTDFSARIITACIKGVDKRGGMETPFGDKMGCGDVLAEYKCNGWVHGVGFSPDGYHVCFTAHDSTVNFVDCASNSRCTLKLKQAPQAACSWVNDNVVVTAGFAGNPLLFKRTSGSDWQLQNELSSKVEKAATQVKSNVAQTLAMFQKQASLGTTNESKLDSVHQQAVRSMVRMDQGRVSTAGLDGKLVIWEVAA